MYPSKSLLLRCMLALLSCILTHIGIYVVGGLAAILPFKGFHHLAQSGILNHIERPSINTCCLILVSLFMQCCFSSLGSMVSRPEDSGKPCRH